MVHGAARIYGAGFAPGADPRDHPLVRDGSPRGEDPGAFRRLLCRKVCAMSVITNAATNKTAAMGADPTA